MSKKGGGFRIFVSQDGGVHGKWDKAVEANAADEEKHGRQPCQRLDLVDKAVEKARAEGRDLP